MTDLRPLREAATNAFGQPATVTVPGGSPVPAVVIWLPPHTAMVPGTLNVRKAEASRVMAIYEVDVAAVPRLTKVAVAEMDGGPVTHWVVDSTFKIEDDHVRVDVLPDRS